MLTKKQFQIVHRLIAIAIIFVVPLAIYVQNGVLEPWMFVLGAVIGFGYWYFFPLILP